MKKLNLLLASLAVFGTVTALSSCSSKEPVDSSKVIKVCASELPHADILNNSVKPLLKTQGYTIKVTILDWSLQNNAVANKDYDANYFQHVPYLESNQPSVELFATCKVHYEPLGIYRGKSKGELKDAKSFEICADTTNAIRALELLESLNLISELPVDADRKTLTTSQSSWTSPEGVKITFISEETLVASLRDYDFAVLPSNTAITGNVKDAPVEVEKDEQQVSGKANILAVRKDDYLNDKEYATKIDVLTDALLSNDVSSYVQKKYNGQIICNPVTQIDLRSSIK